MFNVQVLTSFGAQTKWTTHRARVPEQTAQFLVASLENRGFTARAVEVAR